MLSKLVKLKVHKLIKFGLSLYLMNFINFHFTQAQNWSPVGTGINGVNINTTWALYASDSELFAGGWFNNAGGVNVNNMAQWDGLNWDSVGAGCNGFINAFAVYNSNLYVGGEFTGIGGIAANDIAKWDGYRWLPVGGGIKDDQYGVYSLAVYGGILYAGGSFDSAGGKPIYAIAQWNDTAWSALGTGISAADEDDGVFAMVVYDGKLCIAGDFVVSGGTNIALWDGSSMSAPGGGTLGPVYSLAVYENELYVGGQITQAGGIPANCIALWNSVNWSSPDSGIWGENGYSIVNALTVYNGELYAGGFFDTANGVHANCIAKWDGTNWSSVGSGINVGGDIDAMTVFNNSLFVGGGFDSAGGVYTKNIAVYTTPSSINELNVKNKIAVYPDPVNSIITVKMSYFYKEMPYTIYNQLGQQVVRGKLNSSNETEIDVSPYPCGIYLLSVTDGAKEYDTRFVKN
jgi:trimeric autotransporter adhesin